MKKLFLLGAMVLSALTSWAQTSPYEGVAPGNIVSGGDYYLYNVESGLWLQNNDRKANDWHTRGQLGTRGLDFQLNASGDGYLLNAKFGRKSLNRDDYYLDNNDNHAWVFEAKAGSVSNAVTIKSGTKYLVADSYTAGFGYNNQYNAGTPKQNQWYLNNPENSNNGTWQIVTKEERLAVMKEMGKTEPQDATWLVASPDFANNDTRYNKWTRTGTWARGGDANGDWGRGSMIMESWNSGSEPHMYQTVSVPNGEYSFTLQGFYRDGKVENVGATYNAGNEQIRAKYYAVGKKKVEKDLRSIIDGHSEAVLGPDRWRVNTSGWYVPDNMADCSRCMNIDFGYPNDAILVTVNAGTLTIGVQKNGGAEGDWVIFDNIKLTYLGPVDLSELLAGLNDVIATAEAIDQSKLTPAAAAKLNDAIAAANEAKTSEEESTITAASSALNAVINDVKDMDVNALKTAFDYMVVRGYNDAIATDVLTNALTASAVNDAVGALKIRFKQHVADKSVQPTQFTKVTEAILGQQDNVRTFEETDLAKGLYIYNVGTGRWFCGGDDWGAHAAVGFPGIKVTLPADNYGTGQYNSIITHLYNGNWGNGGKLNHDGYCDTGGNGWKFYTVDAEKGIVTIARNGSNTGDQSGNDFGRKNLVGFSNNTYMRLDTDKQGADNPYNQWIFVTEAQRDAMAKAAMATASEENPVDLTYKIGMPGFNQRERVEGSNQDGETLAWTCNHANYRYNTSDDGSRLLIMGRGDNHHDFVVDLYGGQWNDSFSWTQTITGLTPGMYRVKVQGYNTVDDENSACLVANGKSVKLRGRDSEAELPWQGYPGSTFEAPEYFQVGLYWNEVVCAVGSDGKITLGIESPNFSGDRVSIFDNFRLEYIGEATEDVEVSEAEWATYVPAQNVEFNTDVNAYRVSEINNGYVILEQITEAPANNAVLVNATKGTHTAKVVAAAEIADNALKVSDGVVVAAENTCYVLAKHESEMVGFYPVSVGSTITAGKGYLQTETANARFISLFGNGTDAIQGVIINKMDGTQEVYNLAGQRMSKAVKGLNIVDGKKVIK